MSIQAEIQKYIRTEILKDPAAELEATTPLLELGILDSFTMLNLVGWLEKRWSIEIASDQVVPDHFATIERIASLVERHAPKG